MDSKWKSITETALSTKVGFWINYASNFVILPFFAIGIANRDWLTFLEIGVIYTFISIVRQYAFRRMFNRLGANTNFLTLLQIAHQRIKNRL